jgi:hypothetical protein
VISYALMQLPEFMRDLQAASAELKQVPDLPAEPDLGRLGEAEIARAWDG